MKCKYSNAYQLLKYLSCGSSALALASRAASLLYCVRKCCIFLVVSDTEIPSISDIPRNSSFLFCLSLRVSQSDGFQRLAFTCNNSINFNVFSFDHSIALQIGLAKHKHWTCDDNQAIFADKSLDCLLDWTRCCSITATKHELSKLDAPIDKFVVRLIQCCHTQ